MDLSPNIVADWLANNVDSRLRLLWAIKVISFLRRSAAVKSEEKDEKGTAKEASDYFRWKNIIETE